MIESYSPHVTGGNQYGDGHEPEDGEQLVREELVRLQRQYRNMEMKRVRGSIELGTTDILQRRRVISYENEQDEILANLTNILSLRNKAMDQETIRIILEILDSFTAHEAEVDNQIMQISEMDQQVCIITKRVIAQKIKVQAIFGNSMTPSQSQRHQKILENRLYRVTTQFDTQVTKNNVIRQEINLHLMERKRFHDKYQSLKKQIAGIKRHMGDLVDIATGTYDQREECVSKIKAIRERNDKESRSHILEMKEHQRLLQNRAKSTAFMETKSKARQLIEEDHVRFSRQQNAKEKHYDELLRSYRKSFRGILAISECRDVQSLLLNYLAQENRNFTQFQYLSTINCEVDFLQRAIIELRILIEDKAMEHKNNKMNQLKSLRIMEKELEEVVEVQKMQELNFTKCKENLKTLIASLQSIFELTECDKLPIMRLLGGQDGKICAANINLCMELLEDQIRKIQVETSILDLQKSVEVDNAPLPTINKTNVQGMLGWKGMGGFIKPRSTVRLDPSTGEDEEDEKSNAYSFRPFTFNELKIDLLRKYQKAVGDGISTAETPSSVLSIAAQ